MNSTIVFAEQHGTFQTDGLSAGDADRVVGDFSESLDSDRISATQDDDDDLEDDFDDDDDDDEDFDDDFDDDFDESSDGDDYGIDSEFGEDSDKSADDFKD